VYGIFVFSFIFRLPSCLSYPLKKQAHPAPSCRLSDPYRLQNTAKRRRKDHAISYAIKKGCKKLSPEFFTALFPVFIFCYQAFSSSSAVCSARNAQTPERSSILPTLSLSPSIFTKTP